MKNNNNKKIYLRTHTTAWGAVMLLLLLWRRRRWFYSSVSMVHCTHLWCFHVQVHTLLHIMRVCVCIGTRRTANQLLVACPENNAFATAADLPPPRLYIILQPPAYIIFLYNMYIIRTRASLLRARGPRRLHPPPPPPDPHRTHLARLEKSAARCFCTLSRVYFFPSGRRQ